MIKKLAVLGMVLCVSTVSFAQKNLMKGAAKAVSSKASASLGAQVERQLAKQALEPIITTSYGTSVTAYFHRLGNMEFWTPPTSSISNPEFKPFKPAYGSEKRTREWLTQQLTARGFLQEVLENMSYAQLEDLYITYKVFSNTTKYKNTTGKKAQTRDDYNILPLVMNRTPENMDKLNRWALTQPDYYLGNYLSTGYQQSFHPDIKSLRILVISNDFDATHLIRTAQDSYNNIDIDMYGHINLATKRLESTKTKYDIIVTDFFIPGGEHERGAYDVGIYVWNKKLNIPVILLTQAYVGPNQAIMHNIIGQFPYLQTIDDARRLFNYLSNIVATGKAYPNELPPLLHFKQRLKELNLAIEQDPNNRYLYEQRRNIRRILGDKKGARTDDKKAEELFYSK